jgi:hypothetical protein
MREIRQEILIADLQMSAIDITDDHITDEPYANLLSHIAATCASQASQEY